MEAQSSERDVAHQGWVGEGFKVGVSALQDDVMRGCKALYLEPSNGAAKDGAAGMLSGCGRGMASAVLLPLSGGLSFCEALALGTSNWVERR
jgi:hypothetical protein